LPIKEIIAKSLDGEELSLEEGITLFESKDIITLGEGAAKLAAQKHTDNIVTYIVDRNINYTNVCESKCLFCAFYKDEEGEGGYIISKDELAAKIIETKELGGIQILLQGGLNKALKIEFYEDLLKFIKSFDTHIHAFSPPEIAFIAQNSGLSVYDLLTRLKEAGLGSIPGGGAEILVDEIRGEISPGKCSSGEWLDIMEEAHKLGLRTTATMMYGHIETYAQRVEHLLKLRKLQARTEGFTAFIPWSFQEKNSKLASSGSSGFDYLKTVAVSRLILNNFDNLQASWVTQGGKVAQIALLFGANDMGSTMIEENVVAAAGVANTITEEEIRGIIKEAGFIPSRRNTFYKKID